jgi:hypothetical protein
MKIKEYSFADLIALREHCQQQFWREYDREKARSKPSKGYEATQNKWEALKKLAAKEIHERIQSIEIE